MKINYDKIADSVYIQIQKGKIDNTLEASTNVLHDVDKKGNILGIEIINASSMLSPKDIEKSVQEGIPLNVIASTPIAS